jgi:uncharacterized protein YprB with RNaseH-like and TPR domain
MSTYPIDRHALLRQSFVHLTGVGPQTEKRLWSLGLDDWTKLHEEAPKLFKGKRLGTVLSSLDATLAAWDRGDLYYFHCALPANERWRLVAGAVEDVAYFDIEASEGGMPPLAESTAVAFYFRGEVIQAHRHEDKRRMLDEILAEAAVLCTYNGASYDVPFLRNEYGLPIEKAHVDLCPWLRRQGYKGGLKAIQKAMPHLPQRGSMDIDGFDAIRLWRMHERGVPRALETLLTYNAEDALILEPLLVEAYNAELAALPHLTLAPLTSRPQPRLATAVCPEVYGLLRGRSSASPRAEALVDF